MDTTLDVGGLRLPAHIGGRPSTTDGGLLLPAGEVGITHPFGATGFYRHGWTSWSPTGWWPLTRASWHGPAFEGPLTRSSAPSESQRPLHSSAVGALEGPDGNVLLLGGLGLGVPRIESDDRTMTGRSEEPKAPWFIGYGPEQALFARYADLLVERLGQRDRRAGNVWCSWYSYFGNITETRIREAVEGMRGLAFDIVQVDDGWQPSVGDWHAGPDFPSGMAALAEHIRDGGFRPGLWLAPFIASAKSRLFHDRRHLFLHDGEGAPVAVGHNWGAPFYALDTTLPETVDHIVEVFSRVKAWGYDYVKLDFMYAAAIAAPRSRDVPRELAFREAVSVIRSIVGEDTYLLGCGVPVIPSIGLFDGVRVGPDTAPYWYNRACANDYSRPGARNAVFTSLHRLWLRDAFELDPDVVYFRTRYNLLDEAHKRYLTDLARVCDFRGTSDPVDWLESDECSALAEFLNAKPQVTQVGRYRFTIDGRDVDFWPAIDPERHTSDGDLVK